MKILYTSHRGLPDQRIEKTAYIAKKHGHRPFFLGIGRTGNPDLPVFEDIIMLPRVNYPQVVFSRSLRKAWGEAVSNISPDLIHANDIIAGHLSSALGYPMVYDDHEYWSAQRITFRSWPLRQRITSMPFYLLIPSWERRLLENHVTITVSERIAIEHRRHCEHVFVLQNFSLLDEVRDLPVNPERSGVAYVGGDFSRGRFSSHRNMEGLTEHVTFDAFSGLPRTELYSRLVRYRYGLLPFKATSYAKYSNSAKTFDYLNCGLEVIMTRALYEAHERLPFTVPFDEYPDIPRILETHAPADPADIMNYAHENLVWEAQEDKLFEAYELALEK